MFNNKRTSHSLPALMMGTLLLCGLHSGRAHAETQTQQPTEQEVFGRKTYDMLVARQYSALEQRFRPYLDSYARNKISAEELANRFEAFSMMTEAEPQLDQWVQAYPNSYAAKLARGIYHVADAWRKRGNKMADSTSAEQMQGFHDSLKKSRADLLASLPLYARPVDSYRYLIRVAKGQSNGEERAMLDKALQLDPKAYDARDEYFYTIMPRWGGSLKEMAAYVEECNKSPLSEQDKKRIEGTYYYELAQQARQEKNLQASSDYFYKDYLATRQPNILLWSVKIAIEGKFTDLAMRRLDELTKTHPDYPPGFELRAQLYEYHYKDMAKAIKDYLAAADLGRDWSQNHIGWYYMKGIGVPVDNVKAKHYLELAAKQGNQNAAANLDMLKKGN